jgi:ABC-type amino acid transport substrate-binding protein
MLKKPSRRILGLIALIVLALTAPLHAETRTVRVGVFPAAPLVIEKDGKPDGLFVGLLDYFSAKAGWKLRYVAGTWRESLARLENGEIDILPAVSYTPERALEFDFSKNPVFIDSGVLFANPKFALHTIFDLQGRQIAALKGSVFTTDFINYTASFGVSCNILYMEDNEAVMRAIVRGDAVGRMAVPRILYLQRPRRDTTMSSKSLRMTRARLGTSRQAMWRPYRSR